MISNGTPASVVKVLKAWYNTQRFVVRWGKSFSNFFYVSNGVRQGGVMSPLLDDVIFIGNSEKELKFVLQTASDF